MKFDPDETIRVLRQEYEAKLRNERSNGYFLAIKTLGKHRCDGLGHDCMCIESASDAALFLNEKMDEVLTNGS